ncbi:MAG: 30S ribosomal protein S2 [Candidatus Aenigmatarchaeota archaeon]
MEKLLISKKMYLKYFIPLGKGKNDLMKRFIYRELPNGSVVLNIREIDRRIRMLARYLVNKNVIIINRNKKYFYPLEKFKEITGMNVHLGRFLPGTFTNCSSENFIEIDAILVFSLDLDFRAVIEAFKMNVPIFALCNSKSNPSGIDFIIPINNKSKKSIALFLYLLAREIALLKGQIKDYKEFRYSIEDFIGKRKTESEVLTK